MKIIVIGATGTIGQPLADALESRDHEVVRVSRSDGDHRADIADAASLEELFGDVAPFDAVACAAGEAAFDPLPELSDADFDLSVSSKLMGQVNVVRRGLSHLRDGRGSFTLVSGVLAREPMPGSAAVSLVNAAVEGFAGAAALDLTPEVRVNVVSPPWVAETLEAMGRDPSDGLPAATVARAFVAGIEGEMNGEVLDASDYA